MYTGALSPLSAAAAAAAAAGRVALSGHSGNGVLLVSNLNDEVSPFLSLSFCVASITFQSTLLFSHAIVLCVHV